MHHVDVHVRDIAAAKRLFESYASLVGYEPRSDYEEFVSYRPVLRDRPVVGFLRDPEHVAGSMRIAFAVETAAAVDAAAAHARSAGAVRVEGPDFHPEYGDDYYAVFFEDADGNKYEICREEAAL